MSECIALKLAQADAIILLLWHTESIRNVYAGRINVAILHFNIIHRSHVRSMSFYVLVFCE